MSQIAEVLATTDASHASPTSLESSGTQQNDSISINHPSEVVQKFKNAKNLEQFNSTKNPKRAKVHDAKKLLHWKKAQWSNFESVPQYGSPIACGNCKIVPIRCPLSSIYEIHYSESTSDYSPSAIMEHFIAEAEKSPNIINIGRIVDVSESDALLHDKKEWEDWDVEYTKLADKADDKEAPKEYKLIQAFSNLMLEHQRSVKKNLDVAAFELKGYDLVGFLIVGYMVEQLDASLDGALKFFKQSLPPGITSTHYLTLLYRRYFHLLSTPQMPLLCPEKPKWAQNSQIPISVRQIGPEVLTEEDRKSAFVRKPKDINTIATSNLEPTASVSQKPAAIIPTYKPPVYTPRQNEHRTKRRKIRTWTDDVEKLDFGETLDYESEEYKKAKESLEALTGITGFPGCEAIPLTATHISGNAYQDRGCLKKSYLVTWRARGRRALLYLTKEHTFLVSRDMSMTKINMKFPRKRASGESLTDTLIDGVLVEDRDQHTKVLRFLAFDIMFIKGAPVWQMKLEKRLHYLQNEVISPKKSDTATSEPNLDPFRIRMKDHFHLSKTAYLLDTFVKTVTHNVDGVIYTPTEASYNLGGYECEDPIFKFVASENGGCGIPGLDGSITDRRLLNYIQSIPSK